MLIVCSLMFDGYHNGTRPAVKKQTCIPASDDDIRSRMRAIIDIPEKDLAELRRIQKKHSVSRAELIRRAIEQLLRAQKQPDIAERPGFGAWKKHRQDGVAYQRRLRAEWDR